MLKEYAATFDADLAGWSFPDLQGLAQVDRPRGAIDVKPRPSAEDDWLERRWGYIVGTYDKDAGPDNQRLYLNGTRVAQMSDTLPIDLNSAALGIGRHVSGIADPFNGHIDAFRIAHVQRSDGWIATTWNNMSDPGAFAAAGAEEQEGGEPPPLAGAGVVVCLMA